MTHEMTHLEGSVGVTVFAVAFGFLWYVFIKEADAVPTGSVLKLLILCHALSACFLTLVALACMTVGVPVMSGGNEKFGFIAAFLLFALLFGCLLLQKPRDAKSGGF
jgi:hypothetical protein